MKLTPTVANKYPTFRDHPFKDHATWLAGKRRDDNAERLWRIHDKLYDFKDFIDSHPGGSEWLRMTKGIDITEQFECHHIRDVAEKMLHKFYVRDAALPRNYKLTFHPNGFYRTLKQRVANKLSGHYDKSVIATSKFYCDLIFVSTILSIILASRDYNLMTVLITASCLVMLTIISHNFLHQRDNWRMYLMNVNLQSFRDWRVVHVLSHHGYPNSLHDLECVLFEPFLCYMPVRKSFIRKYGSWFYEPFINACIIPRTGILRILGSFYNKYKLHWDDIIPYTVPLLMYIFGNVSLFMTLVRWMSIISISSIIYGYITLHASHHHYKAFHDGDELKSFDFGIYQLAATFDRVELQTNNFAILVTFGQHIAHHFFPTLDHALLPQLNDIIYETCKEFEADLILYPWYKLFIGQYQQLSRTKIHTLKHSKG